MNDNPLNTPQREVSGSTTFSKYEYQYHWALCKIIDEQRNAREYALFMELHEDVVFANSLNCGVAEFEFYQVKNIGSPKYNINNITKKKGDKNSILGKLINSVLNKPFSNKINTINLVASWGFSLEQLDNKLNLEVITIGDLSQKAIDELEEKIKDELGFNNIPENLCFVVPSLGLSDQQDSVIGKISKLIADIFPNSHCNASYIYRTLIDELHRKGVVSYDYNKWDDLLENKAVTSPKVTNAISAHISLPDIQKLLDEASEIASEIGLSYLEKKGLKKNIENIHIKSLGFPTSFGLKVHKSIVEVLGLTKTENLSEWLIKASQLLPQDLRDEMGNSEDVRDYIIYEVITGDV